MSAVKTACPISRETFHKEAKPIVAQVNGSPVVLSPREFSTGGLGFYAGDKIAVVIDGVPCKAQLTLSLVLVGSKEAK